MARIVLLILIAAGPFAVGVLGFGLRSDLIWALTVPIAVSVLSLAFARSSRVAFAAYLGAVALATFGLVFLHYYYQVTLIPFSSQLALESWHDSVRAVNGFPVGFVLTRLATGLVLATGAAGLARFAIRRGETYLATHRPTRRERVLLGLVLVAITVTYARAGWRGIEGYRVSDQLTRLRRSSAGRLPPMRTGDDVLILQLESLNATAAYARDGDRVVETTPLPQLKRIQAEGNGTLFPFFWANASATNRALESILCGISGNVTDGTRDAASPLAHERCLPQDLRDVGYRTRMYHSAVDAHFYSWDTVLKQIGFDDVRAGADLVPADTPRTGFGYDDCAFYSATGKALRAEPAGPHFTYLEVSMHHAPYGEARLHPEAWAFAKPADAREVYLNSLLEQDHCLAEFWRVVKARDRRRLHVFILGDHSVPLKHDVDLEDRFFTTMLYVPPVGRAKAPRTIVSAQPPAQADLYPTIMDLLYGLPDARSFASTLRGGAYDAGERCSTSINMHGLVVHARADRRAYYSFDGDRAAVLDRAADGSWVTRAMEGGFLEFEKTNACP